MRKEALLDGCLSVNSVLDLVQYISFVADVNEADSTIAICVLVMKRVLVLNLLQLQLVGWLFLITNCDCAMYALINGGDGYNWREGFFYSQCAGVTSVQV